MLSDNGTLTDRTARSKIRSLAEMSDLADEYRRTGQKIVLAHGTFDLLHLGHVRYLEEARRQGDVLFVTVTADRFVNKGPTRPAFGEHLRAEMLGALSCVDWVAINNAQTAVNVIESVRPDVYVKGVEYRDAGNDVTGKIVDERRAVEAYGGTVHFSDDATYSSSELINRYLDTNDPEVRRYLEHARSRGFLMRIPELIDRIADKRVLLIGETIVDEYIYVSPLGRPPKESVLATLRQGHEVFAGGVVAAANHVADFCREVNVITAIGERESYEDTIRRTLRPNVGLSLYHRSEKPTIRKIRYIEHDFYRKLFEVYVMDDAPLPSELESRMLREIESKAKDADVVIVTDFGHGLISPRMRETLARDSRFLAVNAQSNSANHGFNLVTKYSHADYVCIDAPEARLAIGDKDADPVKIAGELLHKAMSVDRLVVTHGRNGCVVFDRNNGIRRVPAFTRRVLDTMGAGDAFFSVTAPLAAITDDMEAVGFIGNIVGSVKVGILGHRATVEKATVLKYVQTLLK